jgi:hypothetical protein
MSAIWASNVHTDRTREHLAGLLQGDCQGRIAARRREYVIGKDVQVQQRGGGCNLQRLRDIPVPGRVWLLPRDRQLPEGLVINYKTIDHPLLNVSRKMRMSELIAKLEEVETMMTDTGVKI